MREALVREKGCQLVPPFSSLPLMTVKFFAALILGDLLGSFWTPSEMIHTEKVLLICNRGWRRFIDGLCCLC